MTNSFAEKDQVVSFFTNCYEGDWERVLIGDRLRAMIERCGIDFFEKILIINNVNDRNKVEKFAAEAVEKKIIDAYYFSEDHSEQILSAFSITRKSFMLDFYDGYWYSMGPLSAVYFCKSKYLLYFTCDCIMSPNANSLWIEDAIKLFKTDAQIFVANPVWNNELAEASKECFKEDNNWYYGSGFSDQCFLVEKGKLYGNIYNEYHRTSERYPVYAGRLFEMRVDSYMKKKQFIRITSKNAYYIHEKMVNESFSFEVRKSSPKKKLKELAGIYSRKIRVLLTKK